MPHISIDQYKKNREQYYYYDKEVRFKIVQTGDLPFTGPFNGIYPKLDGSVPPNSVNMRKFEKICQSVFEDCRRVVGRKDKPSQDHLENLKAVTCAIVHWKMAFRGGTSNWYVENVRKKWSERTYRQLLEAYCEKGLGKFCIGGVRIPTASAFLRFLYPDEFGIMDRRLARFTQEWRKTNLSLRKKDGYIDDCPKNINGYYEEYMPFLIQEAARLNEAGVTFADFDEDGNPIKSRFRPCDVEMALFESAPQATCVGRWRIGPITDFTEAE